MKIMFVPSIHCGKDYKNRPIKLLATNGKPTVIVDENGDEQQVSGHYAKIPLLKDAKVPNGENWTQLVVEDLPFKGYSGFFREGTVAPKPEPKQEVVVEQPKPKKKAKQEEAPLQEEAPKQEEAPQAEEEPKQI